LREKKYLRKKKYFLREKKYLRKKKYFLREIKSFFAQKKIPTFNHY
jgi:hypothetical protein